MCEKMKWDYWTYMKQPTWFIETLLMKMSVDAEQAEIETKRLKNKNA